MSYEVFLSKEKFRCMLHEKLCLISRGDLGRTGHNPPAFKEMNYPVREKRRI